MSFYQIPSNIYNIYIYIIYIPWLHNNDLINSWYWRCLELRMIYIYHLYTIWCIIAYFTTLTIRPNLVSKKTPTPWTLQVFGWSAVISARSLRCKKTNFLKYKRHEVGWLAPSFWSWYFLLDSQERYIIHMPYAYTGKWKKNIGKTWGCEGCEIWRYLMFWWCFCMRSKKINIGNKHMRRSCIDCWEARVGQYGSCFTLSVKQL